MEGAAGAAASDAGRQRFEQPGAASGPAQAPVAEIGPQLHGGPAGRSRSLRASSAQRIGSMSLRRILLGQPRCTCALVRRADSRVLLPAARSAAPRRSTTL